MTKPEVSGPPTQTISTLTIVGFCSGMTFIACKWFEAPVVADWSYWWSLPMFAAPFLASVSVFFVLFFCTLLALLCHALFKRSMSLAKGLKGKKPYSKPRVRPATPEQRQKFEQIVRNEAQPTEDYVGTLVGKTKEDVLQGARLRALLDELSAIGQQMDQYPQKVSPMEAYEAAVEAGKNVVPTKPIRAEEIKEPARPKQDDPPEFESVSIDPPASGAHAGAASPLKEMTLAERKKLFAVNEKNNTRRLDRLESSDKV